MSSFRQKTRRRKQVHPRPPLPLIAGSLGVLVLLVAGAVAIDQTGLNQSTSLAAVDATDIVSLTNAERQQNGDGVLVEDPLLDAAANAKAADMAAKGYFAHVGPDGKTPWEWISAAGYPYRYAGENLAVRFDDSQAVVEAWMASPSHRDNILKPQYTEIGVGVAEGLFEGAPATYVVQYFGMPQAGYVSPHASSTAVRTVPFTPAAASAASGVIDSSAASMLR